MKRTSLLLSLSLLSACDQQSAQKPCFAHEDCPRRSICQNGACRDEYACGWRTNSKLEEKIQSWSIYREGEPEAALDEVGAPALDPPALRCALTGGAPYSNAKFYQNLPAAPADSRFTLRMSFYYRPFTTFDDGGEPPVIQAIQLSADKFQDGGRWELALQWRNVDDRDGAPAWFYWDGAGWARLGPAERLRAGVWHHFELRGRAEGGEVRYEEFTIDGEKHALAISVPAVPTENTSKLAVAIQLDGNSTQAPYEVFIDEVGLDTCASDCDPEATWYRDQDGDGFGAASGGVTSCVRPEGHVSNAGDCDDSSGAVSPAAAEDCDAVDDDCNGFTDDTALLRGEAEGGLRAIEAMTIRETGLAVDHLPAFGHEPYAVSPAFFVAPQFPYVTLENLALGGAGRLAASFDPTCTLDAASIRLELSLARTHSDFGVLILPLGGLAPQTATTAYAIDLRRYRALHVRWRAASPDPVRLDVKLKSWIRGGELRAVEREVATTAATDCYDPTAWREETILLDDFSTDGEEDELLRQVAQLELGANGTQLQDAVIHVDALWFEPHPETLLSTELACPHPCEPTCEVYAPGADCSTYDGFAPPCPNGFVYPDLVCGAAISGADKVALSMLAEQVAPELGLLPLDEAKQRAERAIGTLEARGRWGTRSTLELAPGLLPNWFGVFGEPSPRDRHISLTDVADEVATMMALSALFSERGWVELAARARALADGGLSAIRHLQELGREECNERAIYGAYLLGDDDTRSDFGIQCGWRHTAVNDGLLGSALAIAAGAVGTEEWLNIVTGHCSAPENSCAEPCSAPAECSAESGLCEHEGHAFIPACFPGGACEAADDPPYTAEGGLFEATKSTLFLYGGAHPVSGARALPTDIISIEASAHAAARAQAAFAETRGLAAWGWSNCADPRRPNYLGGRCLETDVVTPHGLLLALSADPAAACAALGFLDECTPIGRPFSLVDGAPERDLGMRDAIDLGPWNRGEAECGDAPPDVARDVWLSMDVAMGILSYFNHATGGRLRFLFEAGGGHVLYETLGTATAP